MCFVWCLDFPFWLKHTTDFLTKSSRPSFSPVSHLCSRRDLQQCNAPVFHLSNPSCILQEKTFRKWNGGEGYESAVEDCFSFALRCAAILGYRCKFQKEKEGFPTFSYLQHLIYIYMRFMYIDFFTGSLYLRQYQIHTNVCWSVDMILLWRDSLCSHIPSKSIVVWEFCKYRVLIPYNCCNTSHCQVISNSIDLIVVT